MSIPNTEINEPRRIPTYLVSAIKTIVEMKVPTKEIQLSVGEPLHYYSPEGYVALNPDIRITQSDIRSLMEFAAEDRYIPADRIKQRGHYDETLECLGRRLRCNFYKQQGQLAVSIRSLPSEIPSYDELNGPEHLIHLVDRSASGLVLVIGPVGAGKSTTMAAVLEHLNQNRDGHILTLEDPIEFKFVPKRARVSQRSVGENCDTPTFHEGLRGAKRQNANIIMVGEMRDAETVKAAFQSAESGALVFGSTHASSGVDTVEALMSYFDPIDREHMRNVLATILRCVCSQKLLPTADKTDYVLAYEYMARSPAIVTAIRDNDFKRLRSIVEQSANSDGTTALNMTLKSLVDKGKISAQAAMLAAYNKPGLATKLGLDENEYV